jgi:hypothetical protein
MRMLFINMWEVIFFLSSSSLTIIIFISEIHNDSTWCTSLILANGFFSLIFFHNCRYYIKKKDEWIKWVQWVESFGWFISSVFHVLSLNLTHDMVIKLHSKIFMRKTCLFNFFSALDTIFKQQQRYKHMQHISY